MAVLRYKDSNGVYQDLVGINVQNEVVQTTGQSTTAVMSQKAVSDKFSEISNSTAKTTINTESVMLKGTDGKYYNIDKASLSEVIRAELGTILSNIDKGTNVAKVPAIDSNNALGSATVANLVSVLGGVTKNFSNANECVSPCNYYTWISEEQAPSFNLPSSGGDHLLLVSNISGVNGSHHIVQRDFVVQWDGTSTVHYDAWFRIGKNGNTWTNWKAL